MLFDYKTIVLRAYELIIMSYHSINNYDKTLEYAKEGIKIFKNNNYEKGLAGINYIIGTLCMTMQMYKEGKEFIPNCIEFI